MRTMAEQFNNNYCFNMFKRINISGIFKYNFRYEKIKIINLIFFFEAILNLILSIILINYLGILGVAIRHDFIFIFFIYI